MKNLFSEEIVVDCDCGCSKLEIAQYDEEWGGQVALSYYALSYYIEQRGVWGTIKDRIIACWKIATGQKYYFYEVILDKEDSEKLMEFVQKIDLGKIS